MQSALAKIPPIYAESFDSRRPSGWKTGDAADWVVEEGRYQVSVPRDSAAAALYTLATWSDYLAEVHCVSGAASSSPAGIVLLASVDFRGAARGSGYLFAVRLDGKAWQFAVVRRIKGKDEFLHPWTASEVIRPDGNRLAALCFSGLLQFHINGQLVWEGYDGALTSGHVGLFGRSEEGQKVTHSFDQVSIRLVADSGSSAAGSKPPAPIEEPAVPPPPAPIVAEQTPTLPDAQPDVEDRSPPLRPGLLIHVTVYVSGKREIDEEAKRVSDNNQVDMPLIGNLSVDGMTLRDFNATLQAKYRDYFINPQVVAEFVVEDNRDAMSPWGSIVVLGRVKTPGRVNIPPTQDLTLSAAIQQAGGFDTSAKTSSIRLTRRKADGGTERIAIDFSSVGRHGDVDNDLMLKPGDQVFVPESVF